MTCKFVTVKNTDPNFVSYLWGSFDSQKRAIPVKSYNLGTSEESVTFEIKSVTEIAKPTAFQFFSGLIKLNTFLFIIFPLFYVLVKNYTNTHFDSVSMLSATLAVLCLFAGLNIRNDVNDHLSGYDRVNLDLAQKPIRRGWVSAQQASNISFILILVAAVVAIPSLLLNPELAYVLGVAMVFLLLGQLIKKNSYKNQHFGEFALFILVGPLLTSGLQLAADAVLDFEIIVFGILWGLGILFLIQINNFTHIMTSSQHGIRNTMTKLGFDLSQKFLVFCWSVYLFFWCAYQLNFRNNFLGWAGTVLLVLISFVMFREVLNIKSPMGSGLQRFRRLAYKVFLVSVGLLFLQELQTIGVL